MNIQNVKFAKKINFSKEMKTVLYQCLIFAVGFFVTPIKFIFGTYPFGLAFVASCGKYTPFAFAGAVLSVIFNMGGDISYITALVALLGMRIAGSLWLGENKKSKVVLGEEKKNDIFKNLFCEKSEVRVALCTLCTLGISVYTVISNGYLYYDIFVLIFFCVFSAIVTFCFCGAFSQNGITDKNFILATCAFSFCAIYAISGKEIGGVDISIVLSYAVILYLSKYVSGEYSALVGVILGLTLDTPFVPILAIAGITSAFLWANSAFLAILCALIMSVGYGVFASGYNAIVYLLPEALAASMLMYPLIKFRALPHPDFIKKEKAKSSVKSINEVSSKKETETVKNTMSDLSVSFKEIGKMLEDVSIKSKNPDRVHMFNLCLEECEKYCSSCPKSQICWERDVKTTEDNINKMSEALFLNSNVGYDDIEEKFQHRCPNIDDIFDTVNTKMRSAYKENVKNDKLDVSAKNYEIVSDMILSVSSALEKENKKDEVLSEKLKRLNANIGFVCNDIEAYGTRKKRIIATGVDVSRSKCASDELVSSYEKLIGMKMSDPVFEYEQDLAVMTMCATPKYDIENYTSSSMTSGESTNGDTVCVFDGYGDKKYMLICDGMGSGEDAYITSQMCAEFLKKILSVSSEKQLSLSMLNNFIRSKNMECSSSVDLMEIDLLNGNGAFVKSGAAPSFIKRGDSVYKLHSKTAPIGIMKSLYAEELTFSLKKGDVCVMVSDGIVSSEEESAWLVELIKNTKSENISALPDIIIEKSKEKSHRGDDMTVGVAVLK